MSVGFTCFGFGVIFFGGCIGCSGRGNCGRGEGNFGGVVGGIFGEGFGGNGIDGEGNRGGGIKGGILLPGGSSPGIGKGIGFCGGGAPLLEEVGGIYPRVPGYGFIPALN